MELFFFLFLHEFSAKSRKKNGLGMPQEGEECELFVDDHDCGNVWPVRIYVPCHEMIPQRVVC